MNSGIDNRGEGFSSPVRVHDTYYLVDATDRTICQGRASDMLMLAGFVNQKAPPSSAPSVDIERVKAWFYSKPRKQAQAAFTAGDERQIAYMLEDAEAKAVVAMNAAAQSATAPSDARMIPNDEWEKVVYILHWVKAMLDSKDALTEYNAITHIQQGMTDLKRMTGDVAISPAARTEVEHAGGWIPVEWRRNTDPYVSDDTHIRQMRSPFYEGVKFCVRRHGNVLNKTGEWELEPMPSSRDDAFYERCRFDSFEAAVAVLDGPSNTPEKR